MSAASCGTVCGIRLVTDRAGKLKAVIGMSVRRVEGIIEYGETQIPFGVTGNETLAYENGAFYSASSPGVIYPTYRCRLDRYPVSS